MELWWISASGRWLPSSLSFLRTQRRQRRPNAAAKAAASCGWRSEHDGNPMVHGEDGFRRSFGARGTAAGVDLDLAEPMEVAAQEGGR
uniref:DUF834 domain-containing protein n=1 Tax=Oryza sativa subsp. japonica TaxID=39947 RepID=Q10FW9_ORYSJ|nr:hypothetical protein LOC_Os03g44974 [Oryza sativa Japonica Group]